MRNKEFLVLSDIHNEWTHLNQMLDIAQSVDGVIFLGDLIQLGHSAAQSIDNLLQMHEAARWLAAVPGNGANQEILTCLTDLGDSVHGTSKKYEEMGFFGVGGVTDTIEVVLGLRSYFSQDRRPAIELEAKALETLNIFGVSIQNGFFEVEPWPNEKVRELEKYRCPFEHTESEVFDILIRAHESIKDLSYRVLLSHIPPYEEGLNPILPEGVSTGSKAITRFIQAYRPSFALSGHYHRNYRFAIDEVPCAVVPAVKDGYYSMLHFEQAGERFLLSVRRF
jgi:Icc-related predicted phosphoesterase